MEAFRSARREAIMAERGPSGESQGNRSSGGGGQSNTGGNADSDGHSTWGSSGQSGANMSVMVEIQQQLEGLDYPADKDTIIAYAQHQGAASEILDALEQKLDGRTIYNSSFDVSEAISFEDSHGS